MSLSPHEVPNEVLQMNQSQMQYFDSTCEKIFEAFQAAEPQTTSLDVRGLADLASGAATDTHAGHRRLAADGSESRPTWHLGGSAEVVRECVRLSCEEGSDLDRRFV